MLTQLANSDDRSQAIIVVASVQNLSDNVKGFLPCMETLKRGIKRVREGNNLPAPP